MNKTPAAALFKIGCIPNTLWPLPTGPHVKICSRGWGEKSSKCEHTPSWLLFVVSDFSAGFCRMGESISCTLGCHMLGKIWRLLALLASSPVVHRYSLLFLCTSVRENKQRHHGRLFLQIFSHFQRPQEKKNLWTQICITKTHSKCGGFEHSRPRAMISTISTAPPKTMFNCCKKKKRIELAD